MGPALQIPSAEHSEVGRVEKTMADGEDGRRLVRAEALIIAVTVLGDLEATPSRRRSVRRPADEQIPARGELEIEGGRAAVHGLAHHLDLRSLLRQRLARCRLDGDAITAVPAHDDIDILLGPAPSCGSESGQDGQPKNSTHFLHGILQRAINRTRVYTIYSPSSQAIPLFKTIL